jgi:hypothetical protein
MAQIADTQQHGDGDGHEHETSFDIVVNAQRFTVQTRVLTFEQVVALAFPNEASDPNKTFTVTYRKSDEARHEGTLVAGHSAKVKDGTVFSVTFTTRS